MFKSGQLVKWNTSHPTARKWIGKDEYEDKYGYVLGRHKTEPDVWRIMMMKEGSEILHYEEVWEGWLQPVEGR